MVADGSLGRATPPLTLLVSYMPLGSIWLAPAPAVHLLCCALTAPHRSFKGSPDIGQSARCACHAPWAP